MVSTTTDQVESGYLAGEQVTLTATPSATSYAWSLGRPSGSSAGRAAFSDDTASSPTFTPDVAGYYVITCLVDGATLYVLRISVTSSVQATPYQGIRMAPVTDAQVEAPAVGFVLFCGADHSNALCIKNADDSVDVVAVV